MEILKNGKYSCLKRTSDNYFVGDGLGQVDFPMTVRVTAVTGEQKEAVLPSMQNDNNILSNVQFSGFAAGGKLFSRGQKKAHDYFRQIVKDGAAHKLPRPRSHCINLPENRRP